MSAETYQYITLISFKGSLSRGEEGSLCFGERGHFQLAKGTFLNWPDRVIFMCFIQFVTNTPNLIRMVSQFIFDACQEKLADIEANIIFPNA